MIKLPKTQQVVVIGAGGHAKVVIDILRSDARYEVIGCTGHRQSGLLSGVQVLGDDEILSSLYEQEIRHAFVAIGNNAKRRELAMMLEHIGFTLINAVSRHAYIAPSVRLGRGVAVMPGAVINADAVIGSYAIINTGASVDHDSHIGEACHVAPGCHLSGNVHVGDGTLLGTGCTVIDGIDIGTDCIIGAGSVVVRPIPDQTLAYGVPARVQRMLTKKQPIEMERNHPNN
jgi:UDP-perosamine 4-acetyltransferase